MREMGKGGEKRNSALVVGGIDAPGDITSKTYQGWNREAEDRSGWMKRLS